MNDQSQQARSRRSIPRLVRLEEHGGDTVAIYLIMGRVSFGVGWVRKFRRGTYMWAIIRQPRWSESYMRSVSIWRLRIGVRIEPNDKLSREGDNEQPKAL